METKVGFKCRIEKKIFLVVALEKTLKIGGIVVNHVSVKWNRMEEKIFSDPKFKTTACIGRPENWSFWLLTLWNSNSLIYFLGCL